MSANLNDCIALSKDEEVLQAFCMLRGAGGLEIPGRGGPTHATGHVGVGAATLMYWSKLEMY